MYRYIMEYENENFHTKLVQTANNFNSYISTGDFTILHKNVRSVSMNYEEVRLFLLYMAVKFDVDEVLTEIFRIVNPEVFRMDGYKQ